MYRCTCNCIYDEITIITYTCNNDIFSPLQLILNINFSSRTTSIDVQRNLEANVEKRTKDTFGPPPGKRLIVSIDDMNMPQVREGGDERG